MKEKWLKNYGGSLSEPFISNPFLGAVTDVQIWNRSLTEVELEQWSACNYTERGDALDWEAAELNITGLARLTLDEKEVCQNGEDQENVLAFNMRLSFYDSVGFCKRLGTIATAKNGNQKDKMAEALTRIENPLCESWGFYSGTIYNKSSQSWVDFLTREEVTVADWFPGRPGTDPSTENCIGYMTFQRQHYDLHCGYMELCPICQIEKKFQLRGVCKKSQVDSLYVFR